ncbi:hypothetical protein [Limimonas halophila]|uniref:hypothetical protein n=1 Tax=Limimonas halophila TaxID=1082479 RepID=UPI00115F8DBA|nr:hypothetical protein [Limimonas halophila]
MAIFIASPLDLALCAGGAVVVRMARLAVPDVPSGAWKPVALCAPDRDGAYSLFRCKAKSIAVEHPGPVHAP